eukprot:evm.model.scf_1445.6 EVM.evm.TU.scf_1445.6   scf_1445:24223-30330(+)
MAVYGVLDAAAHGAKAVPDAVSELKGVAASAGASEVSEIVLDSMWVLWNLVDPEADARAGDGGVRGALVEAARALVSDGVLTSRKLKETADLDFLERMSMLPCPAEDWKKKEGKALRAQRANLVVPRYKLLQEESEGFAKMVALAAALRRSDFDVEAFDALMEAYIGDFRLDPHRVLDVIVDALPEENFNGSFRVLSRFNREHLADLLGFKLRGYQGLGVPTPAAVLAKMARLVTEGYVDFGRLARHVGPPMEQWVEKTDKWLVATIEQVNATAEIRLNKSGSHGQDGAKRRVGLMGALAIDAGRIEERVRGLLPEDNQRLGLYGEFLNMDQIDFVLRELQEVRGVAAWADAAYPPFQRALQSAIDKLITPVYVKIVPGGVEFARKYLLDGNFRGEPYPREPPGPKLDRRAYLLLEYLGLYIHTDLRLFDKVCRVMKHEALYYHHTDDARGQSTYVEEIRPETVENILAHVILPGLMLIPSSPAKAWEAYEVMSVLDYESRAIVFSCLETLMPAVPILDGADKMAEHQTKQVLKRVFKPQDRREQRDLLKPLARRLSHIAAGAPFSVAWEIIQAAEQYSNLHECYAEALNYCPELLFGALVHCLCYKLCDGREKIDTDTGVGFAPWVQNLSRFIGVVCKIHSWRFEITQLLELIVKEVKSGDMFMPLVLTDIIKSMTGIESFMDLSENQLQAMAGSRALQRAFLCPRHLVPTVGSSGRDAKRLLDALLQGNSDNKLAFPMLILLQKARRLVAINPVASDVKFLMQWTDKANEVASQYLDFLVNTMSREAYEKLLPPLDSLVNDYGLNPAEAFQLFRPLLKPMESAETEDGEIGNESSKMEGVEYAQQNGNGDGLTFSGLAKAVEAFTPLKDVQLWTNLSPEFYALFWSLSAYDLVYPKDKYESECKRVQEMMKMREDKLRYLQRLRDTPRDQLVLLDREIQALNGCHRQLLHDSTRHAKRVEDVKQQLSRTKATLLTQIKSGPQLIAEAFLHHCVLPRLRVGPLEAYFCFHFVMLMNELQVPGFRTILVFDKLVKEIVPCMANMTDQEATALGVLLEKVFGVMERWRNDESLFNKECSISNTDNKVSREHYLTINWRWQYRLAKQLTAYLKEEQYVLKHNALLVAMKIVKVFPRIKGVAPHLREAAEEVRNKDERKDLKTQATRYVGALDAEAARPNRMVEIHLFGGAPADRLEQVRRQTDASGNGAQTSGMGYMEDVAVANGQQSRSRGKRKADEATSDEQKKKTRKAEGPSRR